MAIEVNDITGLKTPKSGQYKQTLSDADYVLRDKKSPEDAKNTTDITNDSSKYAEELAKVKAEARAEAQSEMLSSGFLDKIKAEIKAEMLEEAKVAPKGAK